MNTLEIEIPEDRIGVLIGKEGEVKKCIEEKTGCKLDIDSKACVVRIECEDAIEFIKARDVIRAIAVGFSPDVAMKLLEDEMIVFDVIDLTNYVSNKHLERIKGRIIGKEGKIRRQIEDLLDVNIAIHGKTVAIIGEPENVSVAREAIMMLIDGAQHSTVMRFLERKRRELRSRSLEWI